MDTLRTVVTVNPRPGIAYTVAPVAERPTLTLDDLSIATGYVTELRPLHISSEGVALWPVAGSPDQYPPNTLGTALWHRFGGGTFDRIEGPAIITGWESDTGTGLTTSQLAAVTNAILETAVH
ncbi:hypothetical protein [Glycomyces sp. YM15]|uniref:hypothetical protein n=1 Tax=Glycomyces sp. YM15 TaxID=2800446 RepID=UPI001963B559|nr:hypothetical protein [Glycomyces sp. YM15]